MSRLSERQLSLIQGAAVTLTMGLGLSKEEAAEIIIRAIKKEITKRQTSLQEIDMRPRAERAAFIRATVKNVEEELLARKEWGETRIKEIIERFMGILHDSWLRENHGNAT